MSIEFKSNLMINEFIHQFPEEKRNSVVNFLLILGLDIAHKLGQSNPKELYETMKQLSKYIVRDYSQHGQTEIREEIKKIQQQLVQLNSMFNDPDPSQSRCQEINRVPHFNKPQFSHNRFYTQNDVDDKQKLISKDQSENSKNQYKTSKRSQTNKSPIQINVTAKITESPPPPIVYLSNANNKFNIKPHLDDHQIKQLLYSDNERICQNDFDSISNRDHLQNHSPKSIKYTLNMQSCGSGNESNRDNIGQRFQTHETNKKKQQTSTSSRHKKKVPAYLQNVESKIKARLDHDKQIFKAQKNYEDEEDYNPNYRMSQSQQMTANFQSNKNQMKPSQESETYYEIQQYLINQKNSDFKFSPVQEMKTENQTASNSRKQQNFKEPNKSQLKQSNENLSKKKKDYFEQHENLPFTNSINPIQVSDFQMSKQQSELSFDAFRKKTQFTSPYVQSLQQSSQPIQTSSRPERVDDESSESFSNFTPPNKEVREFFQKQCIYQI